MSEALLGVIIGGIIANISLVIKFISDKCKWKREQKLDFLTAKRNKLEADFIEATKQINKGLSENTYSMSLYCSIDHLFPERVTKAFNKFVCDKDVTDENKKTHFFNIQQEMAASLADIDKEIEKIIGLK